MHKLFCFPFAGGNVNSFKFLENHLNREINVKVLEYPGRGMRYNESFASKIEDIVDFSSEFIIKNCQRNDKVVLYGHSMGALIAYAVSYKLERSERIGLKALVVSGASAPDKKVEKNLNSLSSAQFWKEVINMGGIPEEIKKDKDLQEFFEPVLRSDFNLIDKFEPDVETLICPIKVLFGDQDCISNGRLESWNNFSQNSVEILKMTGDHFFIYDNANTVAQVIENEFEFNS